MEKDKKGKVIIQTEQEKIQQEQAGMLLENMDIKYIGDENPMYKQKVLKTIRSTKNPELEGAIIILAELKEKGKPRSDFVGIKKAYNLLIPEFQSKVQQSIID